MADSRLNERREETAALQLVLDSQPSADTEDLRPLLVDLPGQVEVPVLVGEVPGRDEEREDDPEHEGVDGEESAVVEEDAGPADQGGQYAEGCGDRRENEFRLVRDKDDVGVVEDVEPCAQCEDEGGYGVARKLCGKDVSAGRLNGGN